MRALPGRASRSKVAYPAPVTRTSAQVDQRRRILRAAGELVAKRGYNDVTVELIVKRAHVSFKTFYNHFSNKEACFLALFDTVFGDVEANIRATLASEDRTWPEQVVVALESFVDLILDDPLIARACIVEGPTAGSAIFERYEKATQALAPLFRGGRAMHPEGNRLPATIEVTLAGSVMWSAYQRLIVGEAERMRELLPEIVELVLRPYLGEAEATRIAREQVAKVEAELPAG